MRWMHAGFDEARSFPVPRYASLARFPDEPDRFHPAPGGLLDALAEAAGAWPFGDDPDRILLPGGTDRIVTAEGTTIAVEGGLRLPWPGEVSIPREAIFERRGLPRDQPIGIGRTSSHVALRAGVWTIWLRIMARGGSSATDGAIEG